MNRTVSAIGVALWMALLAPLVGAAELKTTPVAEDARTSAPLQAGDPTPTHSLGGAVAGPAYGGAKLSLNFQDIEVRSVLQLIADFTGLNLVASDTVQGSITLRLQRVP